MKPVTLSESSVQRIARALADSPRIRLINYKLDLIMENQETDQQVLDEIVADLNETETQIATEINDLESKVAALPLVAGATPVNFGGLRSLLAKYKTLVKVPAETVSAPASDPVAPEAAKPNTDAHLETVPDAPQVVKDAATDGLNAPKTATVDPVP